MLRKKIRIGDLLVQNNLITQEQLEQALAEQKNSGRKLGKQVIDMGFTTEDAMIDLLSEQLEVPRLKLGDYELKSDVARNLPETHARRFRALVVQENPQDFLVAMADPSDLFAYDEMSRLLKKEVQVGVVREGELLEAMDAVYRRTEEISNIAEELGGEMVSEDDIDLSALPTGDDHTGAPVVRLLQSIFEDAVQIGASDIHIEPGERDLRIRLRVDGVLQEQVLNQKNIVQPLVSRLKLMCNLNISERRLPQDGRFQVRVKNRSIDVRLSTLPLQYGEAVVMRLLDHTNAVNSLENVGMPPDILQRFRLLINQPNGLVLVTGPTGSGKSTTLYGGLAELNKPGVKIITVEDPVEYRVPRINQVQVREDIGLTFPRVLRTALRQDPDIVMVGEMRDEETAEVGMRAAVTGHMVFSTLHTNDAISTAIRLMDMGIESYMLGAALRAILAQRLLRRVCTHCREPYTPTTPQRAWLRSSMGVDPDTIELTKGRGCHHCNRSGYSGRIGAFELLELDGPMVEALRKGDQSAFAHAAAVNEDYRPMSSVALDYAAQGITTLEEVFRVLGAIDESADEGGGHFHELSLAEQEESMHYKGNDEGAARPPETSVAPEPEKKPPREPGSGLELV